MPTYKELSERDINRSRQASGKKEREIPEGTQPEYYTEEHEKLLGSYEEEWELTLDGYNPDRKTRIYDPVNGKTCHQCRYNSNFAICCLRALSLQCDAKLKGDASLLRLANAGRKLSACGLRAVSARLFRASSVATVSLPGRPSYSIGCLEADILYACFLRAHCRAEA